MRILLVEDEKKLANFIERGLKEECYAVDHAYNGQDALYLADINEYDLIILDIMLPDKNGIEICKELRRKKINTPVLVLTALDGTKEKIKGLDSGADDYLTKPFNFDELLARIRALLRRESSNIAKTTLLRVADLEFDRISHTVRRGQKEIALTPKEYALLEYLITHQDQAVTRTMISEHVWDEHFDTFTNVIDVYVNSLRDKIDKPFKKPLIHTMRGVGYILKD